MPINYGTNNVSTSGIITAISGNFNALQVNGTGISAGTGLANHIAYWTNANTLASDSGELVWDSTNNRFGIGIIAPSSTLDVIGESRIRGVLYLNQTSTDSFDASRNNCRIERLNSQNLSLTGGSNDIQLAGDAGKLILRSSTVGIEIGSAYSNTYVMFNPGNSEKARITPSGNLGIGFTAPSGKLGVNGGVTVGANYNLNPPSNGAIIEGNVGIANSAPSFPLDVSGVIRSSSYITANSDFRLNNQAFSRVGHVDTNGGFVGGYNVYMSGLTPLHNSTGAVSACHYYSDGSVRFLSNSSQNSNTTVAERLRITSNGWVGINTTTPSGHLDVAGDVYVRGTGNNLGTIYLKSASSTDTGNKVRVDANGNLFLDASAAYVKVGNQDGATEVKSGANGVEIGQTYNASSTNQNIRFTPAGTERVRITNLGNVGIGTSTPSGQLHVIGSGFFSGRVGIGTGAQALSPTESLVVDGNIRLSDTAGNRIQFHRGGGTLYDYSIAKEGNHLAVSTANDGSSIRYTQFGYHNVSTWTPKVVIDNYNGRLGIGTTSPTAALHVIGTSGIRVGDSSTNGYIIGPTGNTYIHFNAAGQNRIDINSNTYTGSSTYLATQYTYLNNAAIYCNGTFQFPMANNDATSTATQRDSNSIIIYNKLWNGSAQVGPGNEIVSKASTTVNLQSRLAFLVHNGDGTQNRTERLSVVSNGMVGVNNTAPSYALDVVGTGNFSQNLLVNGTGVSLIGHTHTASDITDFNSSVSGLLPTISNSGDNRLLTSTGTTNGINAESNLTFDGSTFAVSGIISASGDITSQGVSVRTKTLELFTPLDNQPPATNFATLDTRNSIAVLDFSDTTEESAVFVGVIPDNALLGSGILVRINWMATTATTGDCRWGVQFEKMNSDTNSDSFDTATEAQSTTNATAGIPTITSITCTSIDSLAAGDFFRLKIYRDASDTVNDTMTDDAELISVELRSIL